MTDFITTTATNIRSSCLPRLSFQKLRIGASLDAVSRLFGDAFNMAYVAPFKTIHQQLSVETDTDLQGRDPSW